jgi:eukaryotic-like serine/threonine-protein kinase
MTPSHDAAADSRQTLVGKIADEFTDRLRRGEHPDPAEYLERYPEIAAELRAILPALAAMRPATRPSDTKDVATVAVDLPPRSSSTPSLSVVRGKPRPGAPAPAQLARFQLFDIRELLLQRLRILVIVGFGAFLIFYVLRFFRLDVSNPEVLRQIMLPGAAYLAAMAVLAWVLWKSQGYSLVQLRIIEGTLVGITAVCYCWELYTTLFGLTGRFIDYAQRHVSEISLLARQPSVMWLTLIVAYGIFIPNTGRRCAIVTCSLALLPLLVTAIAGFLHPSIPPGLVVVFLIELALWVGTGVALAIYGSHKISVLREEALEARKFGQYQLKRRLGAGGMGEVYLAEHLLLRRPCAVKLIRPEKTSDPAILRRFVREVQVTATLTHPNTIQVFDYGQTEDGTFYYAMEYLDGLTLDEIVHQQGPLPAARVTYFLRQLCGALAEAHAIGLIHRDIKPGNVIVCNRGGLHDVAKLLDFGLVHRPEAGVSETRLTSPGLVFGTPAYVSPEQAAAQPGIDARSDIYSLGAMAYYLLTGQPPFVRSSIVQTLAAHISEPLVPLPVFLERVPGDLQGVVLRSLAKDPAARFPDVRTLDQALGQCACAGAWTPIPVAGDPFLDRAGLLG